MTTTRYEIIFSAPGAKQVQRDIKGIGDQANIVRGTLAFMRNALVALAAIRISGDALSFLDQFTNAENRVKLVTGSVSEFNAVMSALQNTAQDTRVSLEDTVALYQQMSNATLGLKLSYEQVIQAVRTTNQLIAISGANSASAKSALLQFSQGLAANKLSGQELNSVLEQFPALARVIAKEFGKSAAELRVLAKNGDLLITAESVMRALAKEAKTTEQQFSLLTITVEQGFTLVKNALIVFIGNASRATGLTNALGQAFVWLANNIGPVVAGLAAVVATMVAMFVIKSLVGTFILLGTAIQGLLFPITAVTGAAATMWAVLGGPGTLLAIAVLSSLVLAYFAVEKEIGEFIKALGGWEAAINRVFANVSAAMSILFNNWGLLWRSMYNLATKAINSILSVLDDFFNKYLNGALNTLIEAYNHSMRNNPGLQIPTISPRTLGRVTEQYGAAGEALSEEFNIKFQQNMANGGVVGTVKRTAEEVMDVIKSFQIQPLTAEQQAELKKLVSGSFTGKNATEDAKGLKSLKKSIDSLMDSVDPYYKGMSKLAEAEANYNKAIAAGIPLPMEKAKMLTLLARDVIGLGNAEFEYSQKLKLIDALNAKLKLSTDEYAAAVRRAREERDKEYLSLLRSVDAYQNYLNKVIETEEALKLASPDAKGVLSDDEILKRTIRELAGVGNATAEYAAQMRILEDALARSAITQAEFNRYAAEAKIKMLENSRDFGAGMERAWLKAQKQATDYAQVAEDALTRAFDGASDALTEFAEKGKINLKSLLAVVNDLIKALLKMFANQALSGASGWINSLFSSGGPSYIGGGDTSSISGYLAEGGPARLGKSYIVGERGPELFTPGVSGYVSPTESLMGGTGAAYGGPLVTVNVVNNSKNVKTTQEETVDSNGKKQLTIMIEDIVAKSITKPGSGPSRAVSQTFNTSPRLSSR